MINPESLNKTQKKVFIQNVRKKSLILLNNYVLEKMWDIYENIKRFFWHNVNVDNREEMIKYWKLKKNKL